MENLLKLLSLATFSDIFKILAGGVVASLLVFWLDRRCKRRSVKMALHVEMKDIQDKSNAILKLINDDSLPDITVYKEFNKINASFKTPVIDSSYDKIDLLSEVVVESIVQIRIIIDNLNDVLKKYERPFIEVQSLVDRNDEIKLHLKKLNILVDKALINLNT